ncbi:MAG: CehA/McbA family metallohydrolase [Chloroflexota bacterium]|nr:CehA/McbA family metallohydrolase [Chloroflexota bacterium]
MSEGIGRPPLPVGPLAPFDERPGVWLRCAFHAHTTESDGWLSPAMLRRFHAIAGYDVLAITDHDRYTPAPNGDDTLLLLGGVELSLKAPASGGPLDLLGLGVTELPPATPETSLADAARAINAAGGLAFVAHPVWSGLRTEELDDFGDVTGIEIFNAGCEMEGGRGHAHAHWDIWLTKGHRLTAIATDDLHTPGFESFLGWTMVHAREKSRPAVLDALRDGRFYATSGPRITALGSDGRRLTIRTTPARSIAFLAQPPLGTRLNAGRLQPSHYARRLPTADAQIVEGQIDGDLLTGATVAWLPGIQYIRIVVTDDHGRMAWTNPLWLTAGD